ncbi:DUF2292 domain-containing protein [Paenibacillus luteus]
MAIRKFQYGAVQIIVHDGRIVQIFVRRENALKQTFCP